MAGLKHPVTQDGRYFVVRGKRWRMANPNLSAEAPSEFLSELIAARSAVNRPSSQVISLRKRPPTTRSMSSNESSANAVVGRLARSEQTYGQQTPCAAWYSDFKSAGRRDQRAQSLEIDADRMR
jgi:hypothetical protein